MLWSYSKPRSLLCSHTWFTEPEKPPCLFHFFSFYYCYYFFNYRTQLLTVIRRCSSQGVLHSAWWCYTSTGVSFLSPLCIWGLLYTLSVLLCMYDRARKGERKVRLLSLINPDITIRFAMSETGHVPVNQQNTNIYFAAESFSNTLLCGKVPMTHFDTS